LLAEGSDQDLSVAEVRSIQQGGTESIRLQELCKKARADDSYQKLKQCIMEGFPDHRHASGGDQAILASYSANTF